MSKFIQLLNKKAIERDVVLEMILLDNLLNSLSPINNIRKIGIKQVYANTVLIKQSVKLELTRVWKEES